MEKFILYKNKKVFFETKGQGFPLVFLHGFLESKDVWYNFIDNFTDKFKVILIDLPGHGKSETYSDTHLMREIADAINKILLYFGIEKCIMIGHSMGGYVSLEFEKKYSDKLISFVMFHSSAANDNTQKIINRKREIDLVNKSKKSLICKTNIPLMYAEQNRGKFLSEINFSKNICDNTLDTGVIASLNGMMLRKNNFELLKNIKKEILFIIGEKDDLIPISSVLPQIDLSNKVNYVLLHNSGHMGFVEEKQISQKKLMEFINKVLINQ